MSTPTLGAEVSWQPLAPITPKNIKGFYCTLEPLDPERHLNELYEALCAQPNQDGWTYLAYGPFADQAAFAIWLAHSARDPDLLFYAICDAQGRALGLVAYLAISLEHGSIEIGHVHFGHAMRRSRISTEAIYLLINQAFNLGFRRCEWKCDSMNQPSAKAALRFGFQYEGLFRQHRVNRGRNRDTQWFSIIDGEWSQLQKRYLNWLNPKNFSDSGVQIEALNIATN
ncbi:GNAT family N-acetyltransferase [Neisseriaceae bacterium CLB008]